MRIYCDGSALNNNKEAQFRVGGCAWINCETNERRAWAYNKNVTNNRSEMLSVIGALNSVRSKQDVTIISDSQYVEVTIANKEQRESTYADGIYYTNTGKVCTNNDCIKLLFDNINRITALGGRVTFEKTRGHAGDKYNELCDKMAVEAARRKL